MELNELAFEDIELRKIPVRIGSSKYYLEEATEDSVAKYNNARMRAVKFSEGKVSGTTGLADVESYLVSLCIKTEQGGSVSLDTVRGWKHKIVQTLFKTACRISEIDEDDDLETLRKQRKELDERIQTIEKDSAGNEPSGTETT